MPTTDATDWLFIFAVASYAMFFVFALAFVFVEKETGYIRFVPLLLLLSNFFIALVPETGFSDVRSQWHEPAAMIPYSLLYFVLGAWLFQRKSMFRSAFAFTSFMAGTSF